MLVFTAAAMFPDLDVLARRFGALPGSPWLHRGALHSLAVALAVGIAIALGVGGLGRSRLRMAMTATFAAASHGVLDTFTGGGAGAMLLWPLTSQRFLAPWHVLPAAPLGLRFLSARGLDVLLLEAAWFAPLLVYALLPRRIGSRRRAQVPVDAA